MLKSTSSPNWKTRQAAECITAGGVIAYPTEAVFGLCCDPFNPVAVMRLLQIKRRDWKKGLILVAADWSQLEFLFPPLPAEQLKQLQDSWPGANTWVIPCRDDVPEWLTGGTGKLAVRVSDHPLVQKLCNRTGALVSTSANHSGQEAARTPAEIPVKLKMELDFLLPGKVLGNAQPSVIRDLESGAILRG